MSSAVFFHNFTEINWKSLAIACIATATAASFSIISSHGADKYLGVLTDLGKQAESVGQYKLARQNFDLALLRARASGKQQELIATLINSARIDHEFDETKLAITLATEALELSKKVYGEKQIETADAMMVLADVTDDSNKSLALYKNAAAVFNEKLKTDDLRRALVLLEMSYCYADTGCTGAAISTVKAAKHFYEQNQQTENQDYARTLIQYATLTDISDEHRSNLLKQALTIQEKVLGEKHPSLSATLSLNAAQEKSAPQKEALLRRALQIDESAFGQSSLQAAADLVALADALESEGKIQEARDLRMRAALACKDKNEILASMSAEFLQSYAQLLRDLKFTSESKRIDSILNQKQAATPRAEDLAQQERENAENDPEYWQRTEMIPIDGIQNFSSSNFDHIQLIYQSAAVKLDAFRAGEIVLSKTIAQCPTGIVNASAKDDVITLSWRDGDGPIWHRQSFKLDKQDVSLIASGEVDAYALELEQQLDSVLKGEQDALDNGAIEVVPSTYINNNFIADAIRKAEHKALLSYGESDAAAAADTLGLVFEFTSKAINSKRTELNEQLSKQDAWFDSWKWQALPLSDYISALNDYGFFLQESGRLKESVKVLSLVTEISPNRAVAYLNLGDSYWKQNKKENAVKAYQLYAGLMKNSREQKQIPNRVIQRLSTEVGNSQAKPAILRTSIIGV